MKGDIVNNIPQFLEHLPIWKANPLDQVKASKQKKLNQSKHINLM